MVWWWRSGWCESPERLVGRTAVVTGCNTGIGKTTLLDLYKRGCRVIMACRDVKKAEATAQEIRQQTVAEEGVGEILVVQLDLSSFSSVRRCAQHLLDTQPNIHLLINNAGVVMCPKTLSEDGFELQFTTNHLGHFLLTLLLLPRMRASAPARIVTVSSMMHAVGHIDFDDINMDKPNAYGPYNAYARSKVANILFTRELARRLEGSGVTTYVVDPGAVQTDCIRHFDEAFFRGSKMVMELVMYLFCRSPEKGAQTTIYCAVQEDIANETGQYYSDCKRSEPYAHARDDAAALKLWDESVNWVKLGDYDPFAAENPLLKPST